MWARGRVSPRDTRGDLFLVKSRGPWLSSVFVRLRGNQRQHRENRVARYRLRFLLQEFDLPRGATILGRSSDCHVTIEDPLVSRRHARIVLTGDHAVLYDLESRNGVKVNGQPVKHSIELVDGDRLRIGTQELVFCRVADMPESPSKTTGFLRHCARCRMPYPKRQVLAPHVVGPRRSTRRP